MPVEVLGLLQRIHSTRESCFPSVSRALEVGREGECGPHGKGIRNESKGAASYQSGLLG